MKRLILLGIVCFLGIPLFAQSKSDALGDYRSFHSDLYSISIRPPTGWRPSEGKIEGFEVIAIYSSVSGSTIQLTYKDMWEAMTQKDTTTKLLKRSKTDMYLSQARKDIFQSMVETVHKVNGHVITQDSKKIDGLNADYLKYVIKVQNVEMVVQAYMVFYNGLWIGITSTEPNGITRDADSIDAAISSIKIARQYDPQESLSDHSDTVVTILSTAKQIFVSAAPKAAAGIILSLILSLPFLIRTMIKSRKRRNDSVTTKAEQSKTETSCDEHSPE